MLAALSLVLITAFGAPSAAPPAPAYKQIDCKVMANGAKPNPTAPICAPRLMLC